MHDPIEVNAAVDELRCRRVERVILQERANTQRAALEQTEHALRGARDAERQALERLFLVSTAGLADGGPL